MNAKDSVTLRQRKDQVELTLRHVTNERREIEINADWLNRAAYTSRVRLLDQLAAWYRDELGEIDRALREL